MEFEKCLKRTKRIFWGLIKINDTHDTLISNVVGDPQKEGFLDLIATCQACGEKNVVSTRKEVVKESALSFPKAFTEFAYKKAVGEATFERGGS